MGMNKKNQIKAIYPNYPFDNAPKLCQKIHHIRDKYNLNQYTTPTKTQNIENERINAIFTTIV